MGQKLAKVFAWLTASLAALLASDKPCFAGWELQLLLLESLLPVPAFVSSLASPFDYASLPQPKP